jgi:pimeloyl-ACP methyl ester carboxylesterase
MSISPFQIAIPASETADLKRRIADTRWPEPIDGVGWAYGTDDAYLRALLEDWQRFDWPAEEKRLNAFPQFTATIEGSRLHFVHVKSARASAIPLLLINGFPSSFVEWLPVVPLLSEFDLVIPSLPGYGFSEVPRQPGMTPRRMADRFAALMQELGYARFAAAGTDWGNLIASLLGADHPQRILGLHLAGLGMTHAGERPAERTPERDAYAKARKLWHARETGYIAIQSTKPQTLGYGLTDSPAGLAAWIAEKFRAWSDHDGKPHSMDNAIPRALLLSNLSVYWYTRTIASAARLYYENRWDTPYLAPGQRIEAPSAFYLEMSDAARGKRGDVRQMTPRSGQAPRERADPGYNVQRWTLAPRGGHFPAIETPQLFAEDLRAFLAGLER